VSECEFGIAGGAIQITRGEQRPSEVPEKVSEKAKEQEGRVIRLLRQRRANR